MRYLILVSIILSISLVPVMGMPINSGHALEKKGSNVKKEDTTSVAAPPFDLSDRCTATPDTTPNSKSLPVVVLDARPGVTLRDKHVKEITRGTAPNPTDTYQFGSGKKVHYFVTNMNPFVLDYKIDIKVDKDQDTAVLAFLTQFNPLFAFSGSAPTGGGGPSLSSVDVQRITADNCPSSSTLKFNAWLRQYDQVNQAILYYETQVLPSDALKGAYDDSRDSYAALLNPQIICTELVNKVSTFKEAFGKIPSDFYKQIAKAQTMFTANVPVIDQLNEEISAFRKLVPFCVIASNNGEFDQLAALASKVNEAAATLHKYASDLSSLATNLSQFKQMDKAIANLYQHPETLGKEYEIGGSHGEYLQVTITISSTEKAKSPASGSSPSGSAVSSAATNPVSLPAGFSENQKIAALGYTAIPVSTSSTSSDYSYGNHGLLSTITVPVRNAVSRIIPSFDGGQTKSAAKDPPATDASGTAAPAASPGTSYKTEFGKPMFSISGGVTFSPLPNPQFSATLGVATDRPGTPIPPDNAVAIVGLTSNSNKRVSPIIQLNTRIVGIGKGIDLHGSFGVTAKYDKAVDVEYLFGPSLSFFDRRLFVTVGAYLGKQQRLANNLFVGQTVSKDFISQSIGLKQYGTKLGFSFTYKIK